MGVLDWLHDKVLDTEAGLISSFTGINDPALAKAAAAGVNASPMGGQVQALAGGLGLVGSGIQKVESIPKVGPAVKFALDLPNRSWDTFGNVIGSASSHTDAAGYFGTLANLNTWDKAWSSWGDPNHVSLGQIIGASVNGTRGLDPLNANDAKTIRNDSADTWYGALTAATTDLAAGFAVPGAGTAAVVAKGARAAKAVNTLEEADKLADIQKAVDAGEIAAPSQRGLRVRSFGRAALRRKPSAENQFAWLAHTMDKGNKRAGADTYRWTQYLRPMMENTGDDAVNRLATVLADAHRVTDDPALQQHLQMNAFLSVQGSKTARTELAAASPLFAKALQTRMAAPPEIGLVDRLAQAHADSDIADFDPGRVAEDYYNTIGDKAEIDGLHTELEKAAESARQARDLERQIRDLKPARQNDFDSARLKENRESSKARVQADRKELANAKADLAEAHRMARQIAKKGNRGDFETVNQMVGEARHRVDDAKAALGQSKADRELFHSTPLLDSDEFNLWKSTLDEATGLRRDAVMSKRWVDAEHRSKKAALRAKKAEIARQAPNLSLVNDRLNDIFALTDDAAVGGARVAPTALDSLKSFLRDRVGEDYLFGVTDANKRLRLSRFGHAVAAIGTPRARGGINVNEATVGVQEFAESLKRSRVFDGNEVRDYANGFLTANKEDRAFLVARAEQDMIHRIGQRDYGLSPEQTEEYLKNARTLYGKGRAHLARKSEEAGENAKVVDLGPDPETGTHTVLDGAWLRSHLADTLGFIDPGVVRRNLRDAQTGGAGKLWTAADTVGKSHQMAVQLWKHGVLIRPGLAVRAMLDTGPRAAALIGAGAQFVDAVNGAQHFLRNRGNGALVRLGYQDAEHFALNTLGSKTFKLDVGDGQKADVSAYEDAANMAAHFLALNKGGSPSRAFRGATTRMEKLQLAHRQSWEHHKAGSAKWHGAYTEYAQVLTASPTARAIMEMADSAPTDAALGRSLARDIFKRKGVEDEFRTTQQIHGTSRDEYLNEIANQVSLMFPTKELRDAARNGAFSRKGGTTIAKKWFPDKASQFDVPGPEAILGENSIGASVSRMMDKFYQMALDNPDLWLARHPVYVRKFKQNIQDEAKAWVKAHPDEEIPPELLGTMIARSKTQATQLVRRTFYDNTRYTGAHAVVTKIAPFFMPWEDALMSWSRLVYDDPNRVFRMAGAWYAPENVSQNLGDHAFVTDQYGNPVQRGEEVEGDKYIVLPVKVGGAKYRINKNALNSIAQGNVWWQAGFGPVEQIGATALLGRVLDPKVALGLVGTDNWLGKELMKGLFLDGEVPKADSGSLVASAFPSWLRNLHKDIWGDNYGTSVSYSLNQQYIDSVKSGIPFDAKAALKKAQKEAYSAGIIRSIMSGGVGMSGNAMVDGEFYVERMRMLNAMTPEQLKAQGYATPEQAFMAEYPEAANLDWSMSQNETGINATVKAVNAAEKYRGLIDDEPDYGWFIVGSDNVGGEFSRTAYNLQQSRTFGFEHKGRKKQTPEQQIKDTLVSQGWSQYDQIVSGLRKAQAESGGDPRFTQIAGIAKQILVQKLAQQNPKWYDSYTTDNGNLEKFWAAADRISQQPGLKNRPDMVLFGEYRQARSEILKAFGLKSFTGTSANSAAARMAARTVGEQYASQNLGFQQTWDRMLAREVEAKPTDTVGGEDGS